MLRSILVPYMFDQYKGQLFYYIILVGNINESELKSI